MKFDVILTNPPYKFGKDKSFYLKFVKIVKKQLKDDGLTAIVMPNRFISPRSQAAKNMRSWLEPIEVRPNVNKHFPGIATSIGVIIGEKKDSPVYQDIPFIFDEGNITRSLLSPAPLVDANFKSISIIDKICLSNFPKMKIDNANPATDFIYIKVVYKRYSPAKVSGGPLGLVTMINSTDEKVGDIVPFENAELVDVNNWFLKESSLGRFLIHSFADFKYTGSSLVHNGFMPIIPEGTDKTDEAIYKLFNLTKEDIEYLEFQLVKNWLPKEPKVKKEKVVKEKKAKKEKAE